jgi:hypothetical protein
MDDKQQKQLKEILKSEFLPLFVGLREELKTLNELTQTLVEKEPPDIQKAEVVNQPQPQEEIAVRNFPDIQKVEVTNHVEPVRSVSVLNLKGALNEQTKTTVGRIEEITKAIGGVWKDLKQSVLKVHVQNPVSFPKSIRVSNLEDIQIPKVEIPKSVTIANSTPAEAIPVVLTKRDRKNFYDAFQQMYVANDVNLERIVKAIQQVEIGEVNVNLDEIEALIGTTNYLLSSYESGSLLSQIVDQLNDIVAVIRGEEDAGFAYGEQTVAGNDTAELCSFVVPNGRSCELKGVNCEGENDGLFILTVDGTEIWRGRNSWTNRTISANLMYATSSEQVVALSVTNLKNQASSFSGNFYGINP